MTFMAKAAFLVAGVLGVIVVALVALVILLTAQMPPDDSQ